MRALFFYVRIVFIACYISQGFASHEPVRKQSTGESKTLTRTKGVTDLHAFSTAHMHAAECKAMSSSAAGCSQLKPLVRNESVYDLPAFFFHRNQVRLSGGRSHVEPVLDQQLYRYDHNRFYYENFFDWLYIQNQKEAQRCEAIAFENNLDALFTWYKAESKKKAQEALRQKKVRIFQSLIKILPPHLVTLVADYAFSEAHSHSSAASKA